MHYITPTFFSSSAIHARWAYGQLPEFLTYIMAVEYSDSESWCAMNTLKAIAHLNVKQNHTLPTS